MKMKSTVALLFAFIAFARALLAKSVTVRAAEIFVGRFIGKRPAKAVAGSPLINRTFAPLVLICSGGAARWTRARSVRLAVVTSAMLFCLFSATSVVAQIQNVATTTSGGTFNYTDLNGNPLPATPTYFDTAAGSAFTPNSLALTLTGDWDYQLPQQAGMGVLSTFADLSFSVGNLPVLISFDELAIDAKWVNGGGSGTAPVTTSGGNAIYAILSGAGATTNSNTNGGVPNMDQTGNGYNIFSVPFTAISLFGLPSYVLPANSQWSMSLDVYTYIDYSGYVAGFPQVTVTNEFGGPLGSNFSGFADSFTWQTVPEPSTWVTFAIGAAALLAYGVRKRRLHVITPNSP